MTPPDATQGEEARVTEEQLADLRGFAATGLPFTETISTRDAVAALLSEREELLERVARAEEGRREGPDWQVGMVLYHPGAGSLWRLTEYVGGAYEDWIGECVVAGRGEVAGRRLVFHREYMDRTFRVEPEPTRANQEATP